MPEKKTVNELLTILDPRYMRALHVEAIQELFSKYTKPPERIVEIGTFCGTGAILLSTIVRPWNGHVTTIDLPWTGEPNDRFTKTVDDWVKELEIDNLTVVRRPDGAEGWLKEYAIACKPQFDFVYIDGGHTWNCVCAQFAMVFALLRLGGWMCFDDIINSKFPDVGDCWKHVVCKLIPQTKRYTVGPIGFAMRG